MTKSARSIGCRRRVPVLERLLAGRIAHERKPGGLPFVPKVMPVSMRVAKFDGDNRVENYERNDIKNSLDPSKPVWVVVHGRVNSENSSQIADMTRNLQALGVQVVTLDWNEGAKDNMTSFTLEGSQWITAVGAWGANQLKALGFESSNIDVIGHSWGSYVAYEIGAHIQGGVKTLVALDPAADSRILLGGRYPGFTDRNFKFSNVAEHSYAFHSSFYGSGQKAMTAEHSYDILAPEGYEYGNTFSNTLDQMRNAYLHGGLLSEIRDEYVDDASREHGFAVSLFSSLLAMQKNAPNVGIAQMFSLNHLQGGSVQTVCREGYEGTFSASPQFLMNDIGTEKGSKSWQAKRFGFFGRDVNGTDISYPQDL